MILPLSSEGPKKMSAAWKRAAIAILAAATAFGGLAACSKKNEEAKPGEIKLVVNRTRNFAYAIIDAAVAGQADIEPAMAAMREVGESLRKDEKLGASILGDMEIWGVDRWELWGINLRGRIKVLPREKDTVRREYLKRLVGAFETRGIKSP